MPFSFSFFPFFFLVMVRWYVHVDFEVLSFGLLFDHECGDFGLS